MTPLRTLLFVAGILSSARARETRVSYDYGSSPTRSKDYSSVKSDHDERPPARAHTQEENARNRESDMYEYKENDSFSRDSEAQVVHKGGKSPKPHQQDKAYKDDDRYGKKKPTLSGRSQTRNEHYQPRKSGHGEENSGKPHVTPKAYEHDQGVMYQGNASDEGGKGKGSDTAYKHYSPPQAAYAHGGGKGKGSDKAYKQHSHAQVAYYAHGGGKGKGSDKAYKQHSHAQVAYAHGGGKGKGSDTAYKQYSPPQLAYEYEEDKGKESDKAYKQYSPSQLAYEYEEDKGKGSDKAYKQYSPSQEPKGGLRRSASHTAEEDHGIIGSHESKDKRDTDLPNKSQLREEGKFHRSYPESDDSKHV